MNIYRLIEILRKFEERYAELRAEQKLGIITTHHGSDVFTHDYPVHKGIMNYLCGPAYYKGEYNNSLLWSTIAGSYREHDSYIIKNDIVLKPILSELEEYIKGGNRKEMMDVSMSPIDLPHLFIILLGLYNSKLIPTHWIGWAGDVIGIAEELDKVIDKLSNTERIFVASHLLGVKKKTDYLQSIEKKYNVTFYLKCGLADLCSDVDALTLFEDLNDREEIHVLSEVLEKYYTTERCRNRFITFVNHHIGFLGEKEFYQSLLKKTNDVGKILFEITNQGKTRDEALARAIKTFIDFMRHNCPMFASDYPPNPPHRLHRLEDKRPETPSLGKDNTME